MSNKPITGNSVLFESNLWQVMDPLASDYVEIDSSIVFLYENFISKIGYQLDRITKTNENTEINIGNKIVTNSAMDDFINTIYNQTSPYILKFRTNLQQLYILYLVALFLKRYNYDYLKLDHDTFTDRVYYPNILNVCAKQSLQGKNFLARTIRKVSKKVKEETKNMVDYQSEFFDNNYIVTAILHLVLTKLIYKFNPLQITEPDAFYVQLINNVLHTYLKGKCSNFFTMSEKYDENESIRFRIYRDALQSAQIQILCSNHEFINKISRKVDKLNYVFLNNEIQRLFTLAYNPSYFRSNNKMIMLSTQSKQEKLETIRKQMPQIYKILSSMCVDSEKKHFLDSEISIIFDRIYRILFNRYKEHLSDEKLKIIIYKISQNLVGSITQGEYIDIYTLNKVNITFTKFLEQLEIYLELILNEIENYELLLEE